MTTSTKTKTSDSHPLYVTWIDESLPGKVGLTMAPGKQCAGAYAGGYWERDLQKDLDHLVNEYQAGLLVCLLEDHELRSLKVPSLLEEARKRMTVLQLPIPDGGVLPDAVPVGDLVTEIERAARAGINVVVHCRGGLGRAGTIGGSYLRHMGRSDDEVFAALRKRHETSCPETAAQRAFIRAFPAARRTTTQGRMQHPRLAYRQSESAAVKALANVWETIRDDTRPTRQSNNIASSLAALDEILAVLDHRVHEDDRDTRREVAMLRRVSSRAHKRDRRSPKPKEVLDALDTSLAIALSQVARPSDFEAERFTDALRAAAYGWTIHFRELNAWG